MPKKTPLYDRIFAACPSHRWMDWNGFLAPRVYDAAYQGEYYAIRHAAGLIDVSPLNTYAVTGPEAAAVLSWALTRDVTGLPPGRCAYVCWCDEQGYLIDDGTLFRLGPDRFMLTTGEPVFEWFASLAQGFSAAVTDDTERTAALAVQGPTSRDLLDRITDPGVGALGHYKWMHTRLAGVPAVVSRTGYTGDLGYEVWMPGGDAAAVWDALRDAGEDFGLLPVGQDAVDIARIEAGLVLNGAEFRDARRCPADFQKTTPFELNLDRFVDFDRGPFVGREALVKKRKAGEREKLVGLILDWHAQVAVYRRLGLPPAISPESWQDGLVWDAPSRQVGHITSAAWSPILKEGIALALVRPDCAAPGRRLKVEYRVAHQRHRVDARVVPLPFYAPGRRNAP